MQEYRFLPVTWLSLGMALCGEEGQEVALLCKLPWLAAVPSVLNSYGARMFLNLIMTLAGRQAEAGV